MKTDLKVKNVVLLGQFNSSFFDKYFFIKNNLVQEEEILPTSIFDPVGITQLSTNKFNFVVTPQQIIITSVVPSLTDGLDSVAVSFVKVANITACNAMGINFHWFLTNGSQSLSDMSKGMFFNDNNKIVSTYFKTGNPVFGSYSSMDFEKSRLKLDIKPVTIHNLISKETTNQIDFSFNFHFDISDPSETLKHLTEYNVYQNQSNTMMSLYGN